MICTLSNKRSSCSTEGSNSQGSKAHKKSSSYVVKLDRIV